MAELATRLHNTDKALSNIAWDHYMRLPGDEAVARTAKALEAKGHGVTVVGSRKEALAALIAAIPDGSSINNGGSTTLSEIGYIDFLKANPNKWSNMKEKILAAPKEEQQKLRSVSNGPDVWVSSISALTEEGDFVAADLTGTRHAGWFAAGKVVIVTGANKIVPNFVEATKRTYDFCLPLESSRVREVYHIPASAINNFVSVRGSNPFGGKGHFHVIVVKDELLGF